MAQMLLLLIQILPSALKALAAWQDYHGERLTKDNRQYLAETIKDAVASKNTSGLESLIKNLGKPHPGNAPNPQEPS